VQARRELQSIGKVQTNLSDSSQILRGKMREMLSNKGRSKDIDDKGLTSGPQKEPLEASKAPPTAERKDLRETTKLNKKDGKSEIVKKFDSREVSKLNVKTEELLREDTKRSKSSASLQLLPAISELLNNYKLSNSLKLKDFEDFHLSDPDSMTFEEESRINERIIELLTDKIIVEKENRLQTEIQIDKLTNQNKRQIEALEKMLKRSQPSD